MGKTDVDSCDVGLIGQKVVKKICIIAADDHSILIFATPFAARIEKIADVELVTIGQMTVFQEEIKNAGFRNIHLAMDRYISPLSDLKFVWRLFWLLRREKVDVVITFTTKPNIYGAPIARFARVPKVVVAVRGLGRVFQKAENFKERVLQVIVSLMLRFAFWCSDLIWFTNPGDLAFCDDCGMVPKEKTILTNNAIDLAKYSMKAVPPGKCQQLRLEFGFAEEDFVVLMVARLVWSKGIREFGEAAELLKDRLPNLKFLLVASEEPNSQQAVPLSFVREMEKRANLTWVNFRKDARDLFAMADLAVLPSYYKEGGYPRALLEPMGMGKPVIAADTPDCRAPVEHCKNGFLVPPRDAGELARRIEEIASNPELTVALGKQSLARVREKFDDRKVAEIILERLGMLREEPAS